MTYPRLKPEELAQLEEQFVLFLISNGLSADAWVKLKQEDQEKANVLIDQFSEMVYANVLANATYFIKKEAKELKLFKLTEENVVVQILMLNASVERSWLIEQDFQQIFADLAQHISILKLYRGSKKLKKSKPEEALQLLRDGCTISGNHYLFEQLERLNQND